MDFPIELDLLLENYSSYLTTKRRKIENNGELESRIYSPATVRTYLRDVKKVIYTYEGSRLFITQDELEDAVNSAASRLKDPSFSQELSSFTKKRIGSSLNNLIGFLKEKGLDIEKIDELFKNEICPKFITRAEYDKILSYISSDSLYGSRDKLVMSFSFEAGLTPPEISNLEYTDFNRDSAESLLSVNVRAGSKKARVLESNPYLTAYLLDFESAFKKKFSEEELKRPDRKYVIIKRKRQLSEGNNILQTENKISSRALRKNFSIIAEKAGFPGLEFRVLRGSYEKMLVDNKETPENIARKLGVKKSRAVYLTRIFN